MPALTRRYYHVNGFAALDNVDSRFASDLSTFIKLCCGGVSPPLASTCARRLLSALLSALRMAS